MKKASRKPSDELRPEYKRSDFSSLASQATNVVVLDPLVARAFPSDRAVNEALRGLLRSKKESARLTTR